ncbi:MAG: tetratricopeptide repeat protein [Pseudomonadota bacterium]
MTLNRLVSVLLYSAALAYACSGYADSKFKKAPSEYSNLELYTYTKILLDDYQGKHRDLTQAGAFLRELLERDPNYAPAWHEVARLVLKGGHVINDEFRGNALQMAGQAVNRAIEIDKKYADGFVLLGHIDYLNGRYAQGLNHLHYASELGTDNPWLELNTAEIYVKLREYERAEALFDTIVSRGPTAPRGKLPTYITALRGKQGLAFNRRDFDAVSALAKRIDYHAAPDAAWPRGDAGNLLCRVGRFEEGLALVQKALRIMRYGVARYNEAFCLYGQWAQLVTRNVPPSESEPVFQEAWSKNKKLLKFAEDFQRSYLSHLAPVLANRARELEGWTRR